MRPSAASDLERERFVVDHTALGPVPFLPELSLHLATEVTPLWHATEAWLSAREVPPPFWAFAWAGGVALARGVLDGRIDVRGKDVIDLAAGGGVVAIAAALRGASRVRAYDLDPLAAVALRRNASANGVVVESTVGDAATAPSAEVVFAGDVFYDAAIARVMSTTLAARAATAAVWVGDPMRAYAPVDWAVAYELDVPTALDLEGRASVLTRVLIPRGPGLPGGSSIHRAPRPR